MQLCGVRLGNGSFNHLLLHLTSLNKATTVESGVYAETVELNHKLASRTVNSEGFCKLHLYCETTKVRIGSWNTSLARCLESKFFFCLLLKRLSASQNFFR